MAEERGGGAEEAAVRGQERPHNMHGDRQWTLVIGIDGAYLLVSQSFP